MDRFYHIMKPNKNTEMPRYHAFLDTETKGIDIGLDMLEQSLKVGWCCFQYYDIERREKYEKWIEFRRAKEVWEFIDKEIPNKGTVWVWAHNMDFDFRVCKGFTELEKLGYHLSKFVFETGRVMLKWIKPGKAINVVDTLNYFKVSLAKLGEDIGIPKMEVDFETTSDKNLSEYCKNDVQIIKVAITRLLEFIYENDFGSFKPTVAAQAFAAYKHRFMEFPLFIHNNLTADEVEVASYKGGRTEAFFIGDVSDKELICLDVNSMYPFMMRDKELPTKMVKIISNVTVGKLKKYMKEYLVIADMEFYIEKPAIGVKRDRLTFPIGYIRDTVTSPEIEVIMRDGIINRIYRICLYEHRDVFKKYVENIYALRMKYKQEGNFSYQLFCKYLLNSLYGKFGQRIQKLDAVQADMSLKDNFILDYYDADLKKKVVEYHFGGKIFMKGKKAPSFDTFTAIPSFITAYARMYLWELIEKAGEENVYYCDTDSLFVSRKGKERLRGFLDSRELGKLGVEDKEITFIRGVKDYDTVAERKIKGIRKDAVKISDRTYEQIQFEKLFTGGRNDRSERVVIKKVRKTMTGIYTKGNVEATGEVKPYWFKEW